MSEEGLPLLQRAAAYALVVRQVEGRAEVLLSRLAEHVHATELWTLPGGGVEHGEHPLDAVRREVREETGLDVEVDARARVVSHHTPVFETSRGPVDFHYVRLVFDGWVPADAPPPRTLEVGGTTVAAAWLPLSSVLAGDVPVNALVTEALEGHRVARLQRLASYVLVERAGPAGPEVLLTRVSSSGAHPGAWTLPGGGVEHGESPAAAAVRELAEETGLSCEVDALLVVHDVHFTGTAPSGRTEDYHGVHVVHSGRVVGPDEPRVVEVGGTTDRVAWVPRAAVEAGELPVLDVVRAALGARV